MANYSQISYGSTGSDVRQLQELLNNHDYNLSVDGIFGANTQSAVKDFQKKNGLAVDGIVGKNTWGVLTSFSGNAQAAQPVKEEDAFTYQPYEEPEPVKQARESANQHYAAKPEDFTWDNQALLDETTDKWLNREAFTYDFSSDPLYQQYKDQYTHLGKLAMMDTMGQAAALTGGYGNSYAQTAGQQAYQGYLQQLNDVMPEIYNAAYGRYQAEGQELYDQIALLEAQRQQAYGENRDRVNDWYNELNYLTSNYQYLDETAYNRHYNDQTFQYGMHRDKETFDYQKERDKKADDMAERQLAASQRSYSNGGGGYTANPGFTESEILSIQKQAGIAQDGIWGPDTARAYDNNYRPDIGKGNDGWTLTYDQVLTDLRSKVRSGDYAGASAYLEDVKPFLTQTEYFSLSGRLRDDEL